MEIERLKKILAADGVPTASALIHYPTTPLPVVLQQPEDRQERAKQRIALFRSLFRGREDVYAKRWTSADGRSGYSPAALMDWTAIHSSNPEDRKKVARQTRTFLPLSDAVVENHLFGKETIGVYPLLPDETCWFLAVDFDKKSWQEDARAYLDTCAAMGVPAVSGTFALRKWRAHLDFLRSAFARCDRAEDGKRNPYANYGSAASTRSRLL